MSFKHDDQDQQMNSDEAYRQAIRNFANADNVADEDQRVTDEQLEQAQE